MAAPTCIITIIKKFTYRGNAEEEWSNRYMLTGATPSGPTVWHDLFEEIAAVERAIYSANVSVVRAYGHISTDPHAASVWSETLATPLPGLLSAGSAPTLPGDDAVFISWSLDRRNSKGKPVYLRKYFHDVKRSPDSPDQFLTAQMAAMNDLGTVLHSGITLDSRKLCDPLGNVVTGFHHGAYVTTRTLKRRGKRP